MTRNGNRTIVIRILVAAAFLAVSLLWLKELTQRRARYAADIFMGEMLTRVGWEEDTLIPVPWRDLNGAWRLPGWYISYSTYFAIGEPISIYVDVLGRIRTSNIRFFSDLIAMPEDERRQRQAEMIKEDIGAMGEQHR